MDSEELETVVIKTAETLARVDERVEHILETVKEMKNDMSTNYVHKSEFEPIKRVVYLLVSAILGAVFVAIVGLVVI